MAKQNILIVDADPESIKVLEVSLKKVGYSVTRSETGADALELIGFSTPDLIISETKLPKMDGFEFCTKLKENEEWANIPFIFLTSERSIEDKIRGLELGVDDYLTKPIFIREILVRVALGLQRREKERLEHRGSKTKFSGNLQDMGVVDLIQTIDLGHKSGVIHIERPDDEGDIYFSDGRLVDAETRSRKGADAIYRMLVWSEGTFEIEFKPIERSLVIDLSTQGLLMEGMRRLDEWGRLQEQLPPLSSIFDIDGDILVERLGEIPDEVNSILKNFNGRSPLLEVVDKGGLGDLEALTVITKLYFEGLITEVSSIESLSQLSESQSPDVEEAVKESAEEPTSPLLSDETIESQLQTVGQGAGFVAALTTPRKTVARSRSGSANTPNEAASLAASGENKSTTSPGMPSPVVDVNDTILGFKVTRRRRDETEPVLRESTNAVSQVKAPTSVPADALPPENSGSGSRKIAEVLDEEVPPSQEAIPVEDEDDEYFEASTYEASLERPSEVPSIPPDEEEEEEDEEDWEEEDEDLDDYWEEAPSHRGRIIGIVIAVVLVLGLGGVGFWIWHKDRAESFFDNAPIVNKPDGKYRPALKVSAVEIAAQRPPKPTAENPANDSHVDSNPVEEANGDEASVESGALTVEATNPEPPPPSDVDGPPGDSQAKYDAVMSKALKSGRKKKVELLREALTYNASSDQAMALLAIQLMERKASRQEAMALAKQASQLNPDNGAAWMALGYVHQLEKNVEEARAAYKKCAACSGPKKFVKDCRLLAH